MPGSQSDKRILFITTMYPDPNRPGTKVCHYFTKEWVVQGNEVIVINLRSMFPKILTDLARLFPSLAFKYVGNHVEMDRNMSIIEHRVDGIPVFSIPIFKYFPHGKYPQKSIVKVIEIICSILQERGFEPDLIMGHFFNPTCEIINCLKTRFPLSKSSIVFHEWPDGMRRIYGERARSLLDSFDAVGFRHKTMRDKWEREFGKLNNTFICYSGTPSFFLSDDFSTTQRFSDSKIRKFIYVGQFTLNKCVLESIQAVYDVYPDKDFQFICIGDGGTAKPMIDEYVKQKHLGENVHFTGRLPREEIKKYYDESECFIMISKSEAFGLVYLEAMSRGCLCIGSSRQGIDGVIIDGENGFLCQGGDILDLSRVIRRINSLSYDERLKIAINARNTAKRLSDENVARLYLEKVACS